MGTIYVEVEIPLIIGLTRLANFFVKCSPASAGTLYGAYSLLCSSHFPRTALKRVSPRLFKKTSMSKVLLVEDDPMISEMYERKFVAAGFDVRIAVSGKAVLDILRVEPFDIVLLDIVLPEMGGMEVLEQIRNPKSGYAPDLKIVMFSNLNEREDREKALRLGANGFISKSEFSPSQLVEEVSRFLKQPGSRQSDEIEHLQADENPGGNNQ